MSTGDLNLDIFLNSLQEELSSCESLAVSRIMKRYPSLNEKEAREILCMLSSIQDSKKDEYEEPMLVVTAPASFSIKARSTKITVSDMIVKAEKSILITGYSLSDYFSDLVDTIIMKSQQGVVVRFYVNDIEKQMGFNKLLDYQGKFLKIYNYPKDSDKDKMAALHAKVISIDGYLTLITSANLSYHGQEGNIEVGSLIKSNHIAKQVEELFEVLTYRKVFIQMKSI